MDLFLFVAEIVTLFSWTIAELFRKGKRKRDRQAGIRTGVAFSPYFLVANWVLFFFLLMLARRTGKGGEPVQVTYSQPSVTQTHIFEILNPIELQNLVEQASACVKRNPSDEASCTSHFTADLQKRLASLPPPKSAKDKILDGVRTGEIVFDIPTEMNQGDVRRAKVRITRSQLESVRQSMQADMGSTPQVENIDVAVYMIATLKPANDSAFLVTLATDEKQQVRDNGFSSWEWNVQALKSGPQQLFLNVGVRSKDGRGGEETSYLPSYEKVIKVSVNRPWAAKHFFHQEWKWIVATTGSIFAFFIGLIWKKSKD
jgi:hypothetical protein